MNEHNRIQFNVFLGIETVETVESLYKMKLENVKMKPFTQNSRGFQFFNRTIQIESKENPFYLNNCLCFY